MGVADLETKVSVLKQTLAFTEIESKKQQKKIQTYETILFNDVKYDQIPHLGIETNTIFDLNGGDKQPGWKIICQEPEKVKELSTKKIITVGVLGP
mgnify:FL=1